MKITQEKLNKIIGILKKHYQGWTGFSDRRFIIDETEYKRATIEKAKAELSEKELTSLLDKGEFVEVIDRLDKIGKDINLLFLAVPMSGDLSILYQPKLDKESFCRAFFDLIYGPGESHERLKRYLDYVNENNLPNKWTFPTYFLFICHPETEMFIKPDTTRRFVDFISDSNQFTNKPDPAVYADILQMARNLKSGLSQFKPEDMVDIQSLIWIVSNEIKQMVIPEEKYTEFIKLFQEFCATYFQTEEGKYHVEAYDRDREVGRKNFQRIIRKEREGEDITDDVLLKLLPHGDSPANREEGAWIHITPAIRKNVKEWFEGAGWVKADNWPKIVGAILKFIERCEKDPGQLGEACNEFKDSPYSKGFQTGMLSPILNAINPDDYFLVNINPQKVINYFTGNKYTTGFRDYPEINKTAHMIIEQMGDDIEKANPPDMRNADLFDAFCPWIVAFKNYDFRNINYWKISPGENAWNWKDCLDGNFIALGWDELGDVSGLKKYEFDKLRDKFVAAHDDWTKTGTDQVWKFSRIKEGDRIVANHGTKKVLGMGTVTGPYYFVPGIRHGHRLPVVWDDLTPRKVSEGGWRKTLIELDYEKFKKLIESPTSGLAEPFRSIFTDREEAGCAFDLMKETLKRLGIASQDDKRFAITLVKGGHMLRLDYGNWVVMQFCEPGYADYPAGVALIEDRAEIMGDSSKWNTFAGTDPRVSMYEIPMETIRSLKGAKRKLFEESFAYIKSFFQNWQASNYARFNRKEIAEAIFDEKKRDRLFAQGLKMDIVFNQETFDLLDKLHENPTREFYTAHKDEFKELLEELFQSLFLEVVEGLPPEITDVMETEKNLFSRILKNDYGKGGAWDYYWGAIYRKNGKRVKDAQLYLWINHVCLEYGFSISELGDKIQNRFLKNCRQNQRELIQILETQFTKLDLKFDSHDELITRMEQGNMGLPLDVEEPNWKEWLRNPGRFEYNLKIILTNDEVLQLSRKELVADIQEMFRKLFPLVLLSLSDDPMPAIKKYLNITRPTIEYSKDDALAELFITEEDLDDILNLLDHKKNIILQGPPGVGKTFAARKIAWAKMGKKDDERIEMVQFHQSYSYEDFVQGIRPGEDGNFKIMDGTFYRFCKRARRDADNDYFLIIDEINRGNLSKIFGELMVLLESDKRGMDVTLAYGEQGVTFSIPKNVYVIGTMNTADRSLALVDYALRRRFCFIDLMPVFGEAKKEEKFKAPLREKGAETSMIDRVLKSIGELNAEIFEDVKNLGPGFQVGHSYFCDCSREKYDDRWYRTIIQYEIAPLLKEYWFDDLPKANKLIDKLLSRESL